MRAPGPNGAFLGALAGMLLLAPAPAAAGNAIVMGEARLDRPTLTALGVQWLVSGDDDHDAVVRVRWRPSGSQAWRDGPPLFRVRPEDVVGRTVPAQFAGSIFDLRPGTTYQVELSAHDPGGGDVTTVLTASTRPVPLDPRSPRARAVSDETALAAALASAQPGDVITLADGVYAGPLSISRSGNAEDPIVIRGTSRDGTVLDGQGCASCNVLEVYGSFVHVENLTLQAANRALRFQTAGAEGNVVRRVHVRDVVLGIGSRQDQKDFYICDNLLEGRLAWPLVYTDDGGQHANDDGIHVEGDGHVVCHNDIAGFGDAMKVEQAGSRAVDFQGNEVRSAYDNGLELDESEGNSRALRNRFTNSFTPLSFQPIYGGPAYAIRNVAVNVASEQMKFHSLGGTQETSGILAWHNTFVSPALALNLQDGTTSHHFRVENNLFVGPARLAGTRAVDWTGGIDDGVFDYDGIFPDGRMSFDLGGYRTFASLAEAQASGVEQHGRILGQTVFASGLVPPPTFRTRLDASNVALAPGSNAIDAARLIPGVNDAYRGAGPDLGALEVGCPEPVYGIRPPGMDESNEPFGCEAGAGESPGGIPPQGVAPGGKGGCGCGPDARAGIGAYAVLVLLAARRRSGRARRP
jgi:hypothetical protein